VAPPAGGGTKVGVTKDSIAIGFFYPKTGFYAGLARDAEPAMRAAFAEAGGAIYGRKLLLNTYDTGSENASTIQTNERRAKDESFLYTSIVSEENVVLGPLANQHKVPAIVGNIDEDTALPLTWVFALPTYWVKQAKMLPFFIRNELKAANKRIGIVYQGTSAAKAAKDEFRRKATSDGMKVVFEQPVATDQSTCANEVSNLQAHQVELVYMMTGPLAAICMLRDARAVAYSPIWTGVGLSWSFNVVAAASGGTANGIRTLNSFTTLDTPAGKHYTEAMRKYEPNARYGAEDDITMLAYGLGVSIVEALRRNGPELSRESFVTTMETKMKGYNSGYYPPVNFAPGDRSGADLVSFSQCCTDNKWTTPNPAWRRL
jgi:ABC-type branched-subunit amino acid transport system substrate-binding protein